MGSSFIPFVEKKQIDYNDVHEEPLLYQLDFGKGL